MSTELTKDQARHLGLGGNIAVSEELGFADLNKTAVFGIKDSYLDLENVGALKNRNPKVVIRKKIDSRKSSTVETETLETWRMAVESDHYYTSCKVETKLIGQLRDFVFARDNYPYQENDFFKPFDHKANSKLTFQNNKFPFARLRFPEQTSNTIDIRIAGTSGDLNFRPKFVGTVSREESRKTYYRWHPAVTRFASGVQKSTYDNMNLSGFNIPYPTTINFYQGGGYNFPTKIATQGPTNVKGLIVISTGTADYKEICYVSPHGLETGYSNSLEDVYTEEYKQNALRSQFSANQLSINNSSWYNPASGQGWINHCVQSGWVDNINGEYSETSLGSENPAYKRFVNTINNRKQIYFDTTVSTQYGSGAWCIAISGRLNVNQRANSGQLGVIYVHQPSSFGDWKKTDPRKLQGLWAVASGHPRAASSADLQRAAVKKPVIGGKSVCRKDKRVTTLAFQAPTLFIDSQSFAGGNVLPDGIINETYTYQTPSVPSWQTNGELLEEFFVPMPSGYSGITALFSGVAIVNGKITGGFQVGYGNQNSTGAGITKAIPSGVFATGAQSSGYIINNQMLNYQEILQSGIQIPMQTVTGYKKSIIPNGHLHQAEPLKDTYFYKFYNQLYDSQIYGKSMATGTWNGVIPSGAYYSVEIITTKLNTDVGIHGGNLSLIYSGYGSLDSIDRALQTGVSAVGAHKLFPKHTASDRGTYQKRYPYRHNISENRNLIYTAYSSGPSRSESKVISKLRAVKEINLRIRQLVDKVLPNANKKNRKWRKMQKLKQKIAQKRGQIFSDVNIPATSEPGAEITKRIRPYAQ